MASATGFRARLGWAGCCSSALRDEWKSLGRPGTSEGRHRLAGFRSDSFLGIPEWFLCHFVFKFLSTKVSFVFVHGFVLRVFFGNPPFVGFSIMGPRHSSVAVDYGLEPLPALSSCTSQCFAVLNLDPAKPDTAEVWSVRPNVSEGVDRLEETPQGVKVTFSLGPRMRSDLDFLVAQLRVWLLETWIVSVVFHPRRNHIGPRRHTDGKTHGQLAYAAFPLTHQPRCSESSTKLTPTVVFANGSTNAHTPNALKGFSSWKPRAEFWNALFVGLRASRRQGADLTR